MKKLVLWMLSLVACWSLSAQVTTSGMSGRVTDVQGEPLVGATVVAVHLPSGTQYGAAADVKGNYTILNMRPGGPYKVSFEMLGYQTVEVDGVSLALGDNAILDNSLKEETLGMETVVITVDGKSSSMRSDRAGAVTSISLEKMELTPTVSRSMNDVLRLSPQSFTLPGTGFAVGGGNFRQSYVTVDGAAFNNAFGIGENLPAGGSPIALDALEQISVAVTPYDVRQSGFTGGAINAITRSGTNRYYATAYTYLTNNRWRGDRVGENKLNIEDARQYTYGASIGGPIVKDKLFFFVNGEYQDNMSAGPSKMARDNDKADWGTGTNYSRPTVGDMNAMSKFLKEKYGYDPGIYQGYSIKTPGWKLMARMDWNINDRNKLNVRFTKTNSKTSSSPSSSTNPMDQNTIYPGGTDAAGNTIPKGQGRTTSYAMYFKNSRYYQEENFTSVAGEWNFRSVNGRLNNTLRFTYSKQNDPRSYDGGRFPSVEILKDGACYMQFGTEFFTEGNLRKVDTYVVTDELSYRAGINNLTFGLQYEHNDAVNGYSQGANGYYVFNSMEDFINGSKPTAFGITHSNSPDLKQFYAEMANAQYSAYVQDELNIHRNFKLTAGIRFEVPVYPDLKNNYNDAYAKLDFGGRHFSTDQVPNARLSVSPRLGFNWDLTGERKYVLRGGTGYFVGRLPFVWLVSAVGNSNVGQTQYLYNTTQGFDGVQPDFHTNVGDILSQLYPGGFDPKTPTAPSSPTIIDDHLKMPATWKSSLALDVRLPGDVNVTVEGIYNKDFHPAIIRNENYYADGLIALSPNDIRPAYSKYNKNNVFFITNGGKKAYYYSFNFQINKSFRFGLDLAASYTYSKAKAYNDGLGSQVTSAYKTNTYSVGGVNEEPLGYATYVAPNRVLASINYHFKRTSVGLLYEGSQIGTVGGYFYSRFSYVLGGNVVGDGGANNLLYIPSSRKELDSWNFLGTNNYSADEMRNDFWTYIEQDKYLRGHKGQYAERGGAVMPWHHQVDLKFSQDIVLSKGKTNHMLRLGVDIQNFANLLNKKWGNYKSVNTMYPISYDTKNEGFRTNMVTGQRITALGTYSKYLSLYSSYRIMFSIRYIFN